jgi:hypothetical protein
LIVLLSSQTVIDGRICVGTIRVKDPWETSL